MKTLEFTSAKGTEMQQLKLAKKVGLPKEMNEKQSVLSCSQKRKYLTLFSMLI